MSAKVDIIYPLKKQFSFRTIGVNPPNKFLFGLGVARNIGEEVRNFGGELVLLVVDKHLQELGLSKRIEKSLSKSGISFDIYNDIESEPHLETANEISEKVRAKDYDLVVGVGGGSTMDIAKVAAITATNSETLNSFLFSLSGNQDSPQPIKNKPLPLILVPTTAGTGSEVSPYVVLSKGDQKLIINDPQAYAGIALVDPLLTVSLPPYFTAGTGFDALSHAIESFMSLASNPLTKALNLQAIKLIEDNLRLAVHQGNNITGRYYMSLAASIATMGYVGALYAHSISYLLTINYGIPHGVGCALALPYNMKYNLPLIEDELAEIGFVMGINKDSNKHEVARKAIAEIFSLLRDVGLPTNLRSVGVKEQDLPKLSEELLSHYYRGNNPKDMDEDSARRFVEKMWKGELDSELS